MKKKIFFIFAVLFVFLFGFNVYAQEGDSNEPYVLISGSNTINYEGYDFEKFATFVAPTTDKYEFYISGNDESYIYLLNDNDEELDSDGYDSTNGKTIVYGSLVKGRTYKLIIHEYNDNNRNVALIIKKHVHNYKASSWSFMNYVYYDCDCGSTKEGEISANLEANSYAYNGNVKTPNVYIKNTAGITLQKNKNYKVSYSSGRRNVGTYKVTISFLDVYSGLDNITKKFKINPKNTSKLTVKALNQSIKAKWAKQTTQTTGYQLRYSTKKTMKSAKTITIKNNKTKTYKIKKLKSKKKYYIQIRTYKNVSSTKYYSDWSKIKSVKVK